MKNNPYYRFLIVLTAASAIGLQLWRTLFNNFAVDVVGLTGFQVGVIQSVREVPGFLAFTAIFLLFLVREQRLSVLSIVCMAGGIILTGFMPSYPGLLLTTLIMSVGFHYYETTNSSLTLQSFDTQQAPVVLGKQRSIAALCNIGVGTTVFLLTPFFEYRVLYVLCGVLMAGAAVWAWRRCPRESSAHKQHRHLIIRRKYWLFYLLNLLSGARRQIFIVFSVFLMVKLFGFTVREVTLLFVLNNVVNYLLMPHLARAINRFGERRVLTLEYVAMFVIFTAYALVQQKWMIALLYILDHVFFNFAMAIKTYFQKIADPSDMASGTAVSFTINHIAAVVLPVVGGGLWMIDYRIPFFVGAGLSVCSLIASQFIPVSERLSEPILGKG